MLVHSASIQSAKDTARHANISSKGKFSLNQAIWRTISLQILNRFGRD